MWQSRAHRIVANTSDNWNATLARFKQGFYDVTADSDQYIRPISHQSALGLDHTTTNIRFRQIHAMP
jgi:hypothetical protein